MLSYKLDLKLSNQLRELSNQIALKNEFLKSLSDDERKAIHRFARVSQVGASTRIENAVLTDAEINWIDTELEKDGHPSAFKKKQRYIENKLSKDRERSIEEVAGCRNMLSLIYEQASDFFPLAEIHVRGLHQELLRFYPQASHYLGQYKIATNSVVEIDHVTKERLTVFQTADPGPMTKVAMEEVILWYNQISHDHPWSLAVACELTYRFLAIHPFQDGNGRLGRGLFLMVLLQSHDKALSGLAPYLAIDRQIERHKQNYYFVLQQCSGGKFHQDSREYKIEIFLKFMLKMMTYALGDVKVYYQKYQAIQKLSESAMKTFECFREFPEKRLQTKEIVILTDMPKRTVIHSLNTLLENQLIQKKGEGASTRYQVIF